MVYGDGIWDLYKEILGWYFNGVYYMIQLPEKNAQTFAP